jgi:hypothetical protein
MKKTTSVSVAVVMVIVAVMVFASTRGRAQGRGGSAPVTVVNTPLPIEGTVALAGTPTQLLLKGGFQDGSVNLQDTILGPRSYTIPAGFSRMLVRHVSCEAILAAGHKVQIFLETNFSFPGVGSPGSLIQLIPDNEIFGALPQPRQVAHADMHAYLGITTPEGPITSDTLTLQAQRDTMTGFGGVTCVVAGELFQ